MNQTPASKKPNIVVVSARGCGRAFGCYGAKTVNTPAIDRMAAEGALFESFFGASSDSSPNQGALFTGRHPQSNGLMGQCEEPWNWEMNDGEIHLAQLLRLDGYLTVLFKRQDETVAMNWKRLGFDEFRAKESNPNIESIDPQKAWTATKVAKEFTSFIGERVKRPGPQRPFYAQIGFHEAVRPFDYGGARRDSEKGVDTPSRLKDGPEAQALVASFQGAVKEIDKAMETILAGLKRCNLDNSTLLVFTSSGGPDLIRDVGTLYEPGIALPLIARWPGKIPPGTRCDQLCCSADFLPSVLEAIESDLPFNLDGKSLAQAMLGRHQTSPHDCIFGIHTDSRYARTNEFKLIVNLTPASHYTKLPLDLADLPAKEPVPPFELYNLKNDPDETDNLALKKEFSQALNILRVKLAAWMEKTGDPILRKVYPTDYFRKALAALTSK